MAFSDAELFRFRDNCECEAIYRRAREKVDSRIADLLEKFDDDEGDALRYLIRNIVHLMELERLEDEERERIRPLKSNAAAVPEEWEARRQPISRREEPTVVKAIRELRRDLKAWESASEPE
jgi:hypothetical protein